MQGGPPGRRPAMHVPNHPTNLGQIAPVLRPNKTGLSFDVILNRLQSELNRSKETASELQTLNTSITDIHESLSGVAVGPSYPPVHHWNSQPCSLLHRLPSPGFFLQCAKAPTRRLQRQLPRPPNKPLQLQPLQNLKSSTRYKSSSSTPSRYSLPMLRRCTIWVWKQSPASTTA